MVLNEGNQGLVGLRAADDEGGGHFAEAVKLFVFGIELDLEWIVFEAPLVDFGSLPVVISADFEVEMMVAAAYFF